MVNVAIAGGTGDLGRIIVDALQKYAPHHRVFILSRKPLAEPAPATTTTTTLVVDYTSIPSLTHTLTASSIHTIISTLGYHGTALSTAQLNLIHAAASSPTTFRFAPSAWAVRYPLSACADLPMLAGYFAAIEALRGARRAGQLAWTAFFCGVFLDYYMGREGGLTRPNCFGVDVGAGVAAVPGDGGKRVAFTWTGDVARFVVEAVDVGGDEVWGREEACLAGDMVTWNEFVGLAEEVRGIKFKVVYDDVEKLKRGEITELPGHAASYEFFPKPAYQRFMAIFEQFTTEEAICAIPPELNARFPEIKPLTVRAMLEQYWGEKQ